MNKDINPKEGKKGKKKEKRNSQSVQKSKRKSEYPLVKKKVRISTLQPERPHRSLSIQGSPNKSRKS